MLVTKLKSVHRLPTALQVYDDLRGTAEECQSASSARRQGLQQVWPLAHGQELPVRQRTLVMGILNVTPDSFSDGGMHAALCATAADK